MIRITMDSPRHLACMLLAVVSALALPTQAQELERSAIASGGQTASGGRFELFMLTGQPVVGRAEGEQFVVRVGALVPRPDAAGSLVFKDGFEVPMASPRHSGFTEDAP